MAPSVESVKVLSAGESSQLPTANHARVFFCQQNFASMTVFILMEFLLYPVSSSVWRTSPIAHLLWHVLASEGQHIILLQCKRCNREKVISYAPTRVC